MSGNYRKFQLCRPLPSWEWQCYATVLSKWKCLRWRCLENEDIIDYSIATWNHLFSLFWWTLILFGRTLPLPSYRRCSCRGSSTTRGPPHISWKKFVRKNVFVSGWEVVSGTNIRCSSYLILYHLTFMGVLDFERLFTIIILVFSMLRLWPLHC